MNGFCPKNQFPLFHLPIVLNDRSFELNNEPNFSCNIFVNVEWSEIISIKSRETFHGIRRTLSEARNRLIGLDSGSDWGSREYSPNWDRN